MATILRLAVLAALMIGAASAQDYNGRGADPAVDYDKLYRDGQAAGVPWDDRNLNLTQADLALLPPRDLEDHQDIPLFYRVIIRKRSPDLLRAGKVQYPRSGAEKFELDFGGLFRDGRYVDEEEEAHRKGGATLELGDEADITNPLGGAETAISINPVNPNIMIAGANSNGGQSHFYSSDGGQTWTPSPNASPLANSCCDPTLAWSPDGTLGYAVTLGNPGGVWFYRSTDNGANWTRTATISSSGSDDKEYLHVDTYNPGGNPHYGNIYVSWHRGNIMRLARSTNQGDSFTVYTHNDSSSAIGSDVTTNASGDVLHFWPETNGTILMSTSTDGGVSFSAKRVIANTNGGFIYKVPAMDQREVFIYVSAAVDLTGGPFHNRTYVCFNDHDNANTSSTPANNHSKIQVGRSEDGGVTWQFSTPHETADIATVDRFHPWMEIDGFGNVHVLYYDTRNDATRRNPDIYHSYSQDGGVTWSTPARITSVSSAYLGGFQWGDYNGMAILADEVRGIWTDNRPGNGRQAFTRDVRVADVGGDFTLTSADPTAQTVCRGTALAPIGLDITGENGFSAPVTVTFDPNPLPTGFSGSITGSPVVPPGTATIQLTAEAGAPSGPTEIRVIASGGAVVHDLTLTVNVLATQSAGIAAWHLPAVYTATADADADGQITVRDLVLLGACPAP